MQDENSGRRFLCDSGATGTVSVVPAPSDAATLPILNDTPTLISATGSSIKTFGFQNIHLRFGGRSHSIG